MTSLALTNPMQVPKITKITVNMGVGEAVADKKAMDGAVGDLTTITGQKPLVTKSRKAIASFKLREGVPVGVQGHAARRAHVRVPRPPDQRGDAAHPRLPRRVGPLVRRPRQLHASASRNRSFSRKSPTTRSTRSAGMDITITTTARDDREGRALLESFNFPFRK